MPDRKTHSTYGTVAGMCFSAYHTRNHPGVGALAEVAGGGLGGRWGGRLPDILDPGIHSHHRDVCHSVAALLGAAAITTEAARRYCRDRADEHRVARQALPEASLPALLLLVAELFWRFVAGLISGLQAGYVSHLLLDAATPRSLPLLCRI